MYARVTRMSVAPQWNCIEPQAPVPVGSWVWEMGVWSRGEEIKRWPPIDERCLLSMYGRADPKKTPVPGPR